MHTTFKLLTALILSTTLLHAQSLAPAVAPVVAVQPLSSGDQAYARSVSGMIQSCLQISLAGRRIKANDPDLSEFSTKISTSFTKQWTPFVDVCQKHKFHTIAIDVSKNQAEAITKMSKLRGTEFRSTYFGMFKPEVQKAIAFITASAPKIQNLELKQNAAALLETLTKTAESLNTKSAEPFTPPVKANKPGKAEKPGKKKK